MYNFYKQKLCTLSGYIAKFLLIMRLTTLILIAVVMQVSATSFAQRITLSERNTPLITVFDKISTQSGYDFLVTSDMLKQARLVNINIKNAELNEVLSKIFEGQPLKFSIESKIVVVSKKEKTILQKVTDYFTLSTVRGVVVNERNVPLGGASVMIMGQNRGYGTTDNGRFFLDNMTGRETLITQYLGYKADTLELHGQKELVIRMVPASSRLSEVTIVNTGYQKLDKQRATGAYGKPDMDIFENRSATMDVVARLDGLVAGVTVIPAGQGAGANRYGTGSNQQSIIRGRSSVSIPPEPLYVVNGIQTPNLSNINPNDIADIVVLKDAAAAAIYGAKAANGVIVITTKSGKKNEKVHVNYSGYISFQGKPRPKDGYYLNSSQLIQAEKEIFDPVTYPWSSFDYSGTTPNEVIMYNQYRGLISAAQANKSLDSLSHIDNRQQVKDLFYRNAFTTNHTVSASAGSNIYTVYSSLSYTDNHSNTPGEVNNSYRLSLNQTITPAKWLTIGLVTSLNNTISSNKNPVSVGAGFLPYQLFEDPGGNPLKLNYIQGYSDARRADYQARSRFNLDYIPLNEINTGYGNNNLLNVSNTANVGVKFWKGLSFQGTYGYQKTAGTSTRYLDHTSYDMRRELLNFTVAPDAQTVPIYYLPATGGKYTTNDTNSQNWTVRNQLVYNTALRGGKDNLNIQAGQEASETSSSLNTAILRGYDDVLKTYTLLDYNKLANPLFGAIGSGYSTFGERPYTIMNEKSRFTSYFGLFNYSFNSKYMLDASIRKDKSSLFASEASAQNKPTYSIGGKWQVTKETFMKQAGWLDDLGLRATYGVTGNSPYLGAGSTYDILNVNQNSITGNSLSVQTPANNKLSWESTHTVNIGVDFAVLNRRLSGNIDLYHKNTTDLLGSVSYNPFTGYTSTTGNIGNITNKGLELSLHSVNLSIADFTWSTGFVFSYNINKLASYAIPSQFLLSANSQVSSNTKIGYALPSMFAYRYAGLDNLGDPQIRLADGTVTKVPNAAKPEDLVYMGTTIPKFNGGFSNNFRYKGLSLSANMVYNLGAVMRRPVSSSFSGTSSFSASSLSGGNLLADFAQRWQKPGDENTTNVPSYIANQGLDYSRRSTSYYSYADINVISASYIKLRDITLSYDLPAVIMRSLKVQKINLFVQTGNYMLWKANKYDIDPEYTGYSQGGRSYSMGLNVTF